ncbi:MAG: glycosyltransferase [Bacteroidia bacterium]|nr:glycosyltransferase [Bacteroidia bacterium]
MAKARIAIVILNWNGRALLEKYLPYVALHNETFADIIVADNASGDDSVAFLKKNYPAIRIIQNPRNGGFAEGYNTALRHISYEYYVLLNSDIEVTPGWLPPALDVLDRNKDVAAVQPKIKSYSQPALFEYAGAAGGFIDRLGYPFCRGRIFDTIEEDRGQYNRSTEIFWASGASLFVRAEVFHELGGFDEDLFSHQEEIDLCWRMKLKGYKIMYCPDSEVRHFGGGMLPKSNPFKTYLNFRNNLIILTKNHPAKGMKRKLFLRLILDGLAAFRFLICGNLNDTAAIAKAHFYFYKSISKTLAKRNAVQGQVFNADISCVYRKSIVWKYFIEGKRLFSQLKGSDFSGGEVK